MADWKCRFVPLSFFLAVYLRCYSFFCCLSAIFSIYMYFLYFSIFFCIFICIYQKIVVPLHRLSERTDMTYCISRLRFIGHFEM